MSESEVGGLSVWNEQLRGKNIQGSTRVPVREIIDYFQGNTKNLRGLDLGSGQGRSTKILKDSLIGSNITALDLSTEGLALTETKNRIQAKAEALPFEPESFDFINVCGVMTNLVGETEEEAKALRENVLTGLYDVLKPGGCIVISDFGAEHLLDDYNVNYKRHALITDEQGTIAVLKSGETFVGKSNEEIAAMRGTDVIERYAHHYTPRELAILLQSTGFIVDRYDVEIAQTPKGKKPIENIIMLASKPANST